MTPTLRSLVKKHQEVINQIIDLFQAGDMDPAEGEAILLYLADLSAGVRQANIKGEWVHPITQAWMYGAEHGDSV
jgi:hypothetical protein